MPITVLSWNIKGFVSCVTNAGNRRTVIERVMNTFDLIFIHEVPNSVNGTNGLTTLCNRLNGLGARVYNSLTVVNGGLGNEDDLVGVLFETNAVTVVDQTPARRPNGLDGRAPAYFNVTDAATAVTREFCAWHAPEPTNSAQLIAQSWQSILKNSVDAHLNGLTAVLLGDFNNGNLSIPRRGGGRQLARRIAANVGTTLSPNLSGSNLPTTLAYRTTNTYDQFFVDGTLLTAIGLCGVYDVMDRLVNDAPPFAGLFGANYDTPQKAYGLYYGSLSDHLPVAIVLTL